MPITAEMNSRQQQMQQRGAAGQGVFPRGPAFAEGPSQAKRFKVEGPVEGGPRPPLPSFYLTSQQLQMLQYLQQNQNSLTPQQQQLLLQLQNHYRLMQQHQQQLRMQQQQQQQQMIRGGAPFSPRPPGPMPMGGTAGPQQQQQQNFPRTAVPSTSPAQIPQQQQQQAYTNVSVPPALSSPSGVSDQELQVCIL